MKKIFYVARKLDAGAARFRLRHSNDFDECTPFPATENKAADSMRLSLRWAKRSKDAHGDNSSALLALFKVACTSLLRDESLAGLTEIGFDGYAMGGLERRRA